MNMAKYCKGLGMDINGYEDYKKEIERVALEIKEKVSYTHGMYYPIDDILGDVDDEYKKLYIIQALKKIGFEFYDNNTLWRF
jgi:hypothetical protein